jgi:hypothetical protein
METKALVKAGRKTKALKAVPLAVTAKPAVSKSTKKKIIIGSLIAATAGVAGYFIWQNNKKKKEDEPNNPTLNPDKEPAQNPQPPAKQPENTRQPPASGPAPKSAKKSTGKKRTTAKRTPAFDIPAPPVAEDNGGNFWDTLLRNVGTKKATGKKTGGTGFTPAAKDAFPLKRGSKGENVRRLQEALVAKYGPSILPRYGADGDFGAELVTALVKAGLPSIISQSTFNVLVAGAGQNNNSVAEQLKKAAEKQDFNSVIALLKNIRDTSRYSEINAEFKNLRINGGVRQTLVTGLLNSFKKKDQQEAIRYQFLRMGLQFDGNKWSLSGLDGLPLVTRVETLIWANNKERLKVPARMVLGNEAGRKNGYTLFENGGKYFLVETRAVGYI